MGRLVQVWEWMAFQSIPWIRRGWERLSSRKSIGGRSLRWCWAAGLVICMVGVPDRALAINLPQGAELFNSNCARCHINGQNLILPDKNLQYDTLQTYQMNSVEAIAYQIRHGKNIMPAFGDQFSPEQLENIATYVLMNAQQGWNAVAQSPSP